MNNELRDNPGVIAPPPLIYAIPLLLGLILHVLYPVHLVRYLPRVVRAILGGSLVGFALTFITIAFRAMRRANTNVNPTQPTTSLVVEGPFRVTRNPLYLSLTLFYAGITILVNTLWPALLLTVILIVFRSNS